MKENTPLQRVICLSKPLAVPSGGVWFASWTVKEMQKNFAQMYVSNVYNAQVNDYRERQCEAPLGAAKFG